jgi:hypothetical protein
MRDKWLLWLAGVVISAFISAAAFWFAFSVSGRVSVEGQISGGSGSQPQVASPTSQRPSESEPNHVPPLSGGRSPEPSDSDVTALWISERSGMPYFFDDTAGKIKVFADGPDHRKVEVGKGKRSGRHLIIQFNSTLDNVDGILELDLSDDGKTMNGLFRGLDPTKEGRVRLLRSTKN